MGGLGSSGRFRHRCRKKSPAYSLYAFRFEQEAQIELSQNRAEQAQLENIEKKSCFNEEIRMDFVLLWQNFVLISFAVEVIELYAFLTKNKNKGKKKQGEKKIQEETTKHISSHYRKKQQNISSHKPDGQCLEDTKWTWCLSYPSGRAPFLRRRVQVSW